MAVQGGGARWWGKAADEPPPLRFGGAMWWGEAPDEPPSLRFDAPGPALARQSRTTTAGGDAEIDLLRPGLKYIGFPRADVAELADALDSKSSIREDVWVRPPPSAPSK